MLSDGEAERYRAVGRLNIAGNRHCTATLIAENLVLTAAHCLYNPLTGRRAPPSEMKFVAGQRRDRYAALRGVVEAVTPDAYAHDGGGEPIRFDLALLTLDAPISPQIVPPIPPASAAAQAGPFRIIAYGRDRAYAASIREDCAMLQSDGVIAVLDCAVTFGVSGAPVLAEGDSGPEVFAVVSAMGTDPGTGDYAVAVAVAPLLAELTSASPSAP
jgi:protease YdgD